MCVLSRESINNIHTKHELNGYPSDYKRWRFFRTKMPDEPSQIDFRGPFGVFSKKYWFIVCIYNYCRLLSS